MALRKGAPSCQSYKEDFRTFFFPVFILVIMIMFLCDLCFLWPIMTEVLRFPQLGWVGVLDIYVFFFICLFYVCFFRVTSLNKSSNIVILAQWYTSKGTLMSNSSHRV